VLTRLNFPCDDARASSVGCGTAWWRRGDKNGVGAIQWI
jgi:hypothetical protein